MSYITYQGKRVNFAGKPIKTSSLHTDLVGYWKLDEADGSVYDSYGNLHGSIRNSGTGVIQNQTGKINNAYQFNRDSSGAVYLPMGQFYAYQSDFTFTAWVYWYLDPDISVSIDLGIIGGETGSGSFVINKGTTYNYLRLESVALDSTGPGAGFCPSASEWAFVAVTCKYIDETHTQQVFYVNDTSVGTSKTWGYPFRVDRSSYTIGVKRPDQNQHFFNGYIDEVGIWQRVLSNDEIMSLYNGSAGKTFPFMKYRQNLLTNIVSYWKLDETSGDTLYDIVGNNNCTYQDISLGAIGKINYSPFITDSGAAIIMSSSISSVFQPGVFSISAWVKFDELPSVLGRSQTIFSIGGSGPLTGIIFTFGNYGTNRFLFQAYESDTNTNGFYSPTITNINSFIHLCITYEGPGKTSTLYINGVASASDNITLPLGTLGVTHTLANTSQYNYDAIYGKIDEVGVWNRALTPTDVSLLYNSGYGRTYPFNEYFDNNIGIVRNGTFDTSAYWDLTGAGLDTYISNGRLYFHNVTYTEVIQSSTNMISPIKPNTDYVLNFDVDISTESVGTMRLKFVNETHAVDYVAYNNYAANSHVVNFKTPSDIGTGGFGIRYGLGYEGDGGYIDNVRLREKY